MRLDIVEEHAEDACFCFEQRQRVLDSLVIERSYLRDLDERLSAHVDALVLAGDAARRVCAGLAAEGTSAAFVTAAVELGTGSPAALDRLATALLGAEPDAFDAMVWAPRLWPRAAGDTAVARWLDSSEDRLHACALVCLAATGEVRAPAVERALRGASGTTLLVAALAAASRLRDRALSSVIVALASHDQPEVRAAALEALLLVDSARARGIAVRQLVDGPGEAASLRVLGIAGAPEDASVLARHASSPSAPIARAALLALGRLGSQAAIDTLIARVGGADTGARVAGFALHRALGPAVEWIVRPEPEADDDAPWSPDDDLPLWSAAPLGAAWARLRPRLSPGDRLRGGRPFAARTPSAARPLGVEHDDGLEDALATTGAPPRDTRALACPPPFAWRRSPARGPGDTRGA